MTDNEIIKALECCISKGTCDTNCPMWSVQHCGFELRKEALDLINRLKAEIERLQKENNQFADIGKLYSEIKTEAIKEFSERLKEIITMSPKNSILIDKWYIDNLVKEMAGEDNV